MCLGSPWVPFPLFGLYGGRSPWISGWWCCSTSLSVGLYLGKTCDLGCSGLLAWGEGSAFWIPVTLCPCAPGSAGASLAQNLVSQTALGQAQGVPHPPPRPPPPRRVRATDSPITSGVFSAGRRMKSWASYPPFHLCSMPILTFLISSKITQVYGGPGQGRHENRGYWVTC